MKKVMKVLLAVLGILYPIAVFVLLVVLKLPVKVLSIAVMAMAFAMFLSATGESKKSEKDFKKKSGGFSFEKIRPFISSVAFLAAGIACFFTNETIFLKLYSVVISVTLLIAFGSTLFFPPTIIFRFAILGDKNLKGSISEKYVERYCKKVCIAWCIFFILNGCMAVYTSFFTSDRFWSIYNGGISYALMGLMFTVEFIIRKMTEKKNPKSIPISRFKPSSWNDDHVMCFEGKWSDGIYKTWKDFLVDSAKVRVFVKESGKSEWIIHIEDFYDFMVSFVALLQCGVKVFVTQNTSDAFIAEVRNENTSILSDVEIEGAVKICDVLNTSTPDEKEVRKEYSVSEDASVYMYTSGSTGKPKAVLHALRELEADNKFMGWKFGEEFVSRKFIATVSQHHIYGILFTILLPFTIGIPFRRKRVEYVEEFDGLTDESYTLISTPAFLKRSVEMGTPINLKSPFILSSGGALLKDVAEGVSNCFGFWPLEIYGSTETCGIATRTSKDGPEWTPCADTYLSLNADGCLIVKSPCIGDKNGFETADLVDILEDGRFILKGRADSIVKIEEKRVSLTEVENRLLSSGLISDVKVIALEGYRQYLAAAMKLNEEGEKKFKDMEKVSVNKYFHEFLTQYFENVVIPKKWRFVDVFPRDIQGKVHKEDIKKLFE